VPGDIVFSQLSLACDDLPARFGVFMRLSISFTLSVS
jgi:hypothetical protein